MNNRKHKKEARMGRKIRFSLCLMLVGLLLTGCFSNFMKGDMALSSKKYAEAVSFLELAAQEKPNDWRVREKLGYAYLYNNNLDKSIAEFQKALELNPKAPVASLCLGISYMKKGDSKNALRIWSQYNDPERPLVVAEIKRLITVLEIIESKKAAKAAISGEKGLKTASVKPNSFAVFYFKDMNPDNSLKAVQKALAAMTITDLANIESINVIDRLKMQALLEEMKLGMTGIVDPGTAPRAGRLLGAEKLVVGNMGNTVENLRINTSTASTTQQKVLNSTSLTGTQKKFFELQKEIVFNIVKNNTIKLTPAEQKKISGYHTKSAKALVYYGQGLEAIDAGDFDAAKDYFTLAAKEDPLFKLAVSGRDSAPAGVGISKAQLDSLSTAVTTALEAAMNKSIDAQNEKELADKEKGVGVGGGGGGS